MCACLWTNFTDSIMDSLMNSLHRLPSNWSLKREERYFYMLCISGLQNSMLAKCRSDKHLNTLTFHLFFSLPFFFTKLGNVIFHTTQSLDSSLGI